MALADTFVRTVKHKGNSAGEKYADGGGMYLLVKAGGKYWRIDYRFADKRKTLALGTDPEVSIVKARKRREAGTHRAYMPYQEQEPIGEKSSPPASPSPLPAAQPKKKTKPTNEITFNAWCARVKDCGEKFISGYAPVWTYAEKVGMTTDWVNFAWAKFKDRYSTDSVYTDKKYHDWRRVLLNAIRDNWFGLWTPRRSNSSCPRKANKQNFPCGRSHEFGRSETVLALERRGRTERPRRAVAGLPNRF